MNFLKRYFSLAYPYHSKPKNLAQSLINFPLQFDSEGPEMIRIKQEEKENDYRFIKEKEKFEGMKTIFETLLDSIAQENFNSLEDLVEFNMLKKLKLSWEEYKNLGYKIMKTGNIDDAKIMILNIYRTSGTFLPYRNLNLPIDKYEYFTKEATKTQLPIKVYRFTDKGIKWFWLNDFPSMDFKKMNQDENVEQYHPKLKEIFKSMKFPMYIESYDIGILSSFKLYVVDQNNTICGGSDDPDKQEFHWFRLDKMKLPPGLVLNFVLKLLKCDKFYRENFSEWLNQYTIVDIDGFMDGNPILK